MTKLKSWQLIGTAVTASLLSLACTSAVAARHTGAAKAHRSSHKSSQQESFEEKYLSKGIASGSEAPVLDDTATTLSDFERSFAVPGTPMRIRFGGYVSGTYVYDIENRGPQDTIAGIAIGTQTPYTDAHVRFAASRTNFAIEVRTPVPGMEDPLKVVLITGFSPLASASGAGRQANYVQQLLANDEKNIIAAAYMEINSFLFGQYASNFMDIDALPELLNFGGNAGAYGIAAPQARYTRKFGASKDFAVALSVENPVTDYTLVNAFQADPSNCLGLHGFGPQGPAQVPPAGFPCGGAPFGPNPYWTSGLPSAFLVDPANQERVPDLILSLKLKGDWGNAFLSGVVRELRVCGNPRSPAFITPAIINPDLALPGEGPGLPPTAQPEIDAHAYSWAVNAAAKFIVGCKSNINGRIAYGYGAGRYLSINTTTQNAWVDINDPCKIHRLYATAGHIAYQHYFNDCWRVGLLYGFVCNNTEHDTPAVINKWINSYVANVFYQPAPIIRFGLEYIYMQRTFLREVPELRVPKRGDISRIEFQARMYF